MIVATKINYIRCISACMHHLIIGNIVKWLVAERPYLIEQTAVAPHITGIGVLAIVKGLWSRPFDRNPSTLRYIVASIVETTRQAKIRNL